MPGASAHLPRPGTYSPVSNSSTAAACRFVRAAQMSFRLIGCACRIMRIAPKEACLASGRTTTSGLFPDLEQSRMPTPRRFGKKPPNGHVSPHTSPTPTSAPAKPWTATAPNGHVSPHTSPTPTSAPAKPWTATAPNRHDSAHTSLQPLRRLAPSSCPTADISSIDPGVAPGRLAPGVVTGRAFRQPARLLRAAHMDVVLWAAGSARPVSGPVTIRQTARVGDPRPVADKRTRFHHPGSDLSRFDD
jgi:hypothetical protein